MTFEDVGWRAVVTNVSDIAAMGGTPELLLVSAILGAAITLDDIDLFIDGMAAACRATGEGRGR